MLSENGWTYSGGMWTHPDLKGGKLLETHAALLQECWEKKHRKLLEAGWTREVPLGWKKGAVGHVTLKEAESLQKEYDASREWTREKLITEGWKASVLGVTHDRIPNQPLSIEVAAYIQQSWMP